MTKHLLLDSLFLKGNVFVYLSKHLLLDSLFSRSYVFLESVSLFLEYLKLSTVLKIL